MKVRSISALSVLLFSFLVSSYIFAREATDLTLEINSSKSGAEAKQDAFEQATEEATHRLTEEFLGAEKTAQHWDQIRGKLLKNSSRYILFIKGSQPTQNGEQTHVTVQLRLAPDSLESLLREMGLFSTGSIRVLPLIQVSESKGSHFVWWTETTDERASYSHEYFKRIFQQLNTQFRSKAIYVLDPTSASFRMGIPSTYRYENLKREDQVTLGQYLKADVILSGRVDIVKAHPESSEQHIEYSLQLWQTKTGRSIGEVTRSEVTSDAPKVVSAVLDQTGKKIFSDLAGKLAEAAASGNLNLNTVRLTFVGPLSYRQTANLKRQLEDLREVHLLRERLFEPSKTTFEAETISSGAELAKALQKARFSGFHVSVENVQDDGLVLGIRATSAQ